jgi:hypothetical protein
MPRLNVQIIAGREVAAVVVFDSGLKQAAYFEMTGFHNKYRIQFETLNVGKKEENDLSLKVTAPHRFM